MFNPGFQNLFSAVRGRGGYSTTQQAVADMRTLSANFLLRQKLTHCAANVDGELGETPALPQSVVPSLLPSLILPMSFHDDSVEKEPAEEEEPYFSG